MWFGSRNAKDCSISYIDRAEMVVLPQNVPHQPVSSMQEESPDDSSWMKQAVVATFCLLR